MLTGPSLAKESTKLRFCSNNLPPHTMRDSCGEASGQAKEVTGLGLSISKSIIDKHYGKFEIDNNKNTCFSRGR
jgi:hypothetical protein